MARGTRAALSGVGKTERLPSPRSVVGDQITSHLRALQAQRAQTLDVEATVGSLVAAAAALLERGLLVSLAVSNDGRAVRMSALIDKEWVPWFAADLEEGAELAAQIVHALRD